MGNREKKQIEKRRSNPRNQQVRENVKNRTVTMWEVFRTLRGKKNVQVILGTRLFCSTMQRFIQLSHVILIQIERKENNKRKPENQPHKESTYKE
jgi:hypothetical protein